MNRVCQQLAHGGCPASAALSNSLGVGREELFPALLRDRETRTHHTLAPHLSGEQRLCTHLVSQRMGVGMGASIALPSDWFCGGNPRSLRSSPISEPLWNGRPGGKGRRPGDPGTGHGPQSSLAPCPASQSGTEDTFCILFLPLSQMWCP